MPCLNLQRHRRGNGRKTGCPANAPGLRRKERRLHRRIAAHAKANPPEDIVTWDKHFKTSATADLEAGKGNSFSRKGTASWLKAILFPSSHTRCFALPISFLSSGPCEACLARAVWLIPWPATCTLCHTVHRFFRKSAILAARTK